MKTAPSHVTELHGKREVMEPLAGGSGIVWTLIGVFGAGIALNLTPCVYPLIPITISYFGGRTGQGRLRLAAHCLLYLLGLAFTNSTLGVIAALTGSLLGGVLQSPFVLILVVVVLLFFAASLFGFWEVRVPGRLLDAASKPYAGYFGSLFMGLTLGVVAAPCLGPFVLGLLTWVASKGSAWLGFLVFFTLSLGLGLPLVVIGMFSGSLDRLPRSGEWMVWVRRLLGWVLVGTAAHYVKPLLPGAAGVFVMVSVVLAAAVHLAWLDRTPVASFAFRCVRWAVGILGILASVYMVGTWLTLKPSVNWVSMSERTLATARWEDKPLMLEFTAEWCGPCVKLAQTTFRDPRVVAEVAKYFLPVKVDLTTGIGGENAKLVKKYKVRGVPTIVFLDSRGRELKDVRIVGFVEPPRLLEHMARALLLSRASSSMGGAGGVR